MLAFPTKSRAEQMFISGQNYMIDNYGKTVTLFYHPYLESAPNEPIGPGNMGDNFLSNGSTSFFPNNNFLADSSGAMIERRATGVIKLLCTYNPKNISEKFAIEANIGVEFKKGYTYIYSKGYMTDYQKIANMDYALFDIPGSSIDPMKFRLVSSPRDKNSIAQGMYFTCWWEQIP